MIMIMIGEERRRASVQMSCKYEVHIQNDRTQRKEN